MSSSPFQRHCPNCGTAFDFQALLISLNPFAPKCSACRQPIKVPMFAAAVLVGVTVILAFVFWTVLAQKGFPVPQLMMVMVMLAVAMEFGFFELLRRGFITSSLVAHDQLAKTQSVSSDSECSYHASQVIPRIKRDDYLANVSAAIGDVGDEQPEKPDSLPMTKSLFGDLVVSYAIDTDEQQIALTPALAEQVDTSSIVPPNTLHDQALANALPFLATIRRSEEGAIAKLTCDHHMMACGVLFPALWDQIEAEVGTEVVIAVLHRDSIWYAPSNNPSAIAELQQAVNEFDVDDHHGLSKTLYVREEGEWVEFTD